MSQASLAALPPMLREASRGFLRPSVSSDRRYRKEATFAKALENGGAERKGSDRRLAAQNPVVPKKHFDAARTPVESVVVWAGDHQMLVLDAFGLERDVQTHRSASEVVLIARDEPKSKAPPIGNGVSRAPRDRGGFVFLNGRL
jgi:hypothetical protein